jgi:hypothetical protein
LDALIGSIHGRDGAAIDRFGQDQVEPVWNEIEGVFRLALWVIVSDEFQRGSSGPEIFGIYQGDTSMHKSLLALCVFAALGATGSEWTTIFDGKSTDGWLINKTGKPLPKANVQEDGLNPHKSGAYIVVHEKPHGDFELEFDYKLSKGCNSGVFLRVSDLKSPVTSGLEIAIDDTTGTGMHDTGAIYDLVAPKVNAQKPLGEWSHMKIVANGSKIAIELNGKAVSEIDVDTFDKPGLRADGSAHKFKGVTVKEMKRSGYLGFQDHGQDCWYKNVKIKDLN